MGRDLRDLQSRDPPSDSRAVEATVVGLEDHESGDVFSALTSAKGRSILAELRRNPATQSELADHVDTSIQNVNYHLENLMEASLVDVVDQLYSEKGVEMNVYASVSDPFVFIAGAADDLEDVRQAVEDSGVEDTAAAGD